MVIHKLKLSADYYDDSASGVKTFEIRKNDRNFKVGDILELREWIWSALEGKGAYTGNVHWKSEDSKAYTALTPTLKKYGEIDLGDYRKGNA